MTETATQEPKTPKTVPCFLCGQSREVKTTKAGKPYVQCDPCGVQVFVRRAEGMERLAAQIKGLGDTPEIAQQIQRLKTLRAQLDQVDEDEGFFDWLLGNEDIAASRVALNREIAQAQAKLKGVTPAATPAKTPVKPGN